MRRSLLVGFALLALISMGTPQEINSFPRKTPSIDARINPRKVKAVKFPPYEDLGEDLRKLLERSAQTSPFPGKTGKALYDVMDDVRKAGLLNIATKAENTPLRNGRSVFAYLEELTELQGDRFFAVASYELQEETQKSAIGNRFRRASQLLHHPPPGFRRVGSFKTRDRRGNLELSFFRMGEDCIVDLDIDEAVGLGHILQVLRNLLTGRPTHPFVIQQILIIHQNLNPGYSVEF